VAVDESYGLKRLNEAIDALDNKIHLRFGKVGRGGLRWSDRPQDFRTEILGLVKAQQVKNAVIS
jgi:NAD-specific glutamate dehydrogenase